MEKRLILAIALSLLVLLSWSAFVSKTQHIDNKAVTTQAPAVIAPQPAPVQKEMTAQELPASAFFKYPTEKYDVTFIEPLAAIKEVTFKFHQNYTFPLQHGFLLSDPALNFKIESKAQNEITFVASDREKKITKRFIFSNSNYGIWLEIKIQNLSNLNLKIDLPLILGELNFTAQNVQSRYQDAAVATKEKTIHLSARKNQEFSEMKFLSVRDRYFCAIIEPEQDGLTGFVKKINAQKSEIGLLSKQLSLDPGQQVEQKFHIYLGPQELQSINQINPNWSMVINYGMFDFIAQILLQLLSFFYGLVHSWGWAIIILSIAVYLILFPLTLKQMRSMKAMQLLQPKIEELRKAYKDNPQRMNKEIMELHKEHKVNPFGGCLPMLLQMPIFFALYQALMRSIALKGAKFLWIKDLSEPDRLITLPASIPLLGNELNILPIIMAIGMFVQQKISTAGASGPAAEQQKMMLIIMPLMFGLVFYHMPAGLVLYWLFNSILMLLYQIRVNQAK